MAWAWSAPPCSDWLLQLSILNLFLLVGGVPHALPQITFATHSQPLLSKSAGKRRLGTSKLGTPGPVRSLPARGGISCPPRHLPIVESERRPHRKAEAKCSEPGVAVGRLPWLGV